MSDTPPVPTREKAPRLSISFLAVLPPAVEGGEDPIVVAANPRPAWLLRITEGPRAVGQWDIWHPLDVVSADALKLLSIEREIAGASNEAYLQRVREQIGYIVPDLPDEIYARLSTYQLLAIGQKCWQVPNETRAESSTREADVANPPAGARESAPSSPAPLAASDGVTPR